MAATPKKAATDEPVPAIVGDGEFVIAAPAPAAPEPDSGGWFRNAGLVELTVIPDGAPSARLEPGDVTWLPRDPAHPHLEPCDAPPPAPAPLPDDTEKEI